MRKLILISLLGLTMIWAFAPAISIQPDTGPYQRLYEDLLYPSVKITTTRGSGSGVVITSTNQTAYILTAAHVVSNYAEVTVEFYHQDTKVTKINAEVVITNTVNDLALLRVLCAFVVKPAKLAPRDYTPYIFTPVWAIGCSLGFSVRPSEGCITSLRALGVSAVQYWGMSAPIVPGNSGGGVFLKDTHELIGIAVWVRTYHGQLITTMGGIVTLQDIYEFLDKNGYEFD